MKQIIIVVTLFCLNLSGLFGQGINFSNAEWESVLDQAKAEGKIVFVDAYTTWCGPCKQMDKKVFSSKKVGTYFNDNFISVKMDMEKPQGLTMGNRYNVFVYPTLLFIDGYGSLVHRVAGYQDVKALIEEGQLANDPSRSLAALDAKYAAGEKSPEFLKTYLEAKSDAMDGSHAPIAAEYLATQEDWSTGENLSIIFNLTESADSDMFEYLAANKPLFIKQYSESEVEDKIQQLVFAKIKNEDDLSMKEIEALFQKAYPSRAAKMTSAYSMTYHRQKGDREGFANAALKHFKKYPTEDPYELNDIAWTFYEVIDDRKLLKGATKLSKKSIKMEKAYFNMDTLAALYSKMGKDAKAIKTASKAIALAKESGEDYSTTEELIEMIKAGKT
jgi:thiol-disulfide isomerase/thioredoxin